ncbi:MAG: chaperone NapD [Gammaproteobacteria bacterium]|nr:chaperone NapD [Gammaproteobacteria bacterium]
MNISGVIVRARPEKLAAVRARLADIAGVEIHAATEDGRLIVTVEEESDRDLADTVLSLHDVPGVLSASMVYHQYLDESH